MRHHVDTEAIERAARALLDSRVQAVRSLAAARQKLLDAQAAQAAAEHEDAAAWIAALRQGWSEEELKKVGFDPPRKAQPRGRRRARGVTSSQRAESKATDATTTAPHGATPDVAEVAAP